MAMFFINLDVTTAARFDMSKFFKYTDNYDPLTSAFTFQLPFVSPQSMYEVRGEDNLPNLLSFRSMRDNQYWWIIMLYNKKLSFDNVATGDIFSVPSKEDLDTIFFTLKQAEIAATKV